jgi:hypothetical protein
MITVGGKATAHFWADYGGARIPISLTAQPLQNGQFQIVFVNITITPDRPLASYFDQIKEKIREMAAFYGRTRR